jgi:hypothetical protein
VPKWSKPPNNKFGISDRLDPNSEFEKSEPPKPELPKPELAKSVLPNRSFPNPRIERPVENDEKEENRGIAGALDEKRFELNPPREACISGPDPRLALAVENPEKFLPKDSFLEFPNECHWLSARTLFT